MNPSDSTQPSDSNEPNDPKQAGDINQWGNLKPNNDQKPSDMKSNPPNKPSSPHAIDREGIHALSDHQIELETRIAAMLMGEASDFERERLLLQIEEQPELAVVYDELAEVHQRLLEITQDEHNVLSESPELDWKLPPARRQAVLDVLESPVSQNSTESSKPTTSAQNADPATRKISTRRKSIIAERIGLVITAACIGFIAIGLMLPSVQSAREAARRTSSSLGLDADSVADHEFSFAEEAKMPAAPKGQMDLNAKKQSPERAPGEPNVAPIDSLASIHDSLTTNLPQDKHFYRDDLDYAPAPSKDMMADEYGALPTYGRMGGGLGMSGGGMSGGGMSGGGMGGEGTSSGGPGGGHAYAGGMYGGMGMIADEEVSARYRSTNEQSIDDKATNDLFAGDSLGTVWMYGDQPSPSQNSVLNFESGRTESFSLGSRDSQTEALLRKQPSDESSVVAGSELELLSNLDRPQLEDGPPDANQDGISFGLEFFAQNQHQPSSEPSDDRFSSIASDQTGSSPPNVALALPFDADDDGASSRYLDSETRLSEEESDAILLGSLGSRSSNSATTGLPELESSGSARSNELQLGQTIRGLAAQPTAPTSGPSRRGTTRQSGHASLQSGSNLSDVEMKKKLQLGAAGKQQGLQGQDKTSRLSREESPSEDLGEDVSLSDLNARQPSNPDTANPDTANSDTAKWKSESRFESLNEIEEKLSERKRSPTANKPQPTSQLDIAGKSAAPQFKVPDEPKLIQSQFVKEKSAEREPFSTFSLHVSDVSFKLALSALSRGIWPESSKIRIEEFVNAFDYQDPLPRPQEHVACRIEQAAHPFLQQRNVLRIAMRTAASGRSQNVPLRLTILLDNSGSMERVDRRQTVRRALESLTQLLGANDQISLISFANTPRLLADSLSGNETDQLMQAINEMPSEGGTNIEAALKLAFEKASERLDKSAQNRVILLTDGAVNLGDANPDNLTEQVVAMRKAGIAFDAAGISAQDLNDEVLEALTRQGDGRYYLLDSLESVESGFAEQIAGALRPSAKNVKVQVEFNPNRVGQYKLLGFEKHRLKKEDFRNDQVDASEMSAAENGVAIYQIEAKPDGVGDVGSVSVRFRDLSTGRMVEKRWPILYQANVPSLDQATTSLQTATVAALLAIKLRGGPLAETVDLGSLANIASRLPTSKSPNDRVGHLQSMIRNARDISNHDN